MRTVFKSLILAWTFATALTSAVAGETNYFLVGETHRMVTGYNDSYVLPLSKAEDIPHALYLFFFNDTATTEIYTLSLHDALPISAKDDINRNFLDPKFPKWSWQVEQFLRFGDGRSEEHTSELQSQSNLVCRLLLEKIIGFWHYTVVRELGPVPLYLSVIPEGQNLEFYWSSPGTNHVYTLESKESVASTNWLALPGAAWPLQTNHWTLPQTNAASRFYRVKAD